MFFLIFLLGGFGGCVQLPMTRVFEKSETFEKNGSKLEAGVLIIDARPPNDYLFSHLRGSLSMPWQDFTQRKDPFQGLLDLDLDYHARRLARLGIGLDTPVLVVGNGLKGQGEEGRVAWTLKVLGLRQVSIRSISQFSVPFSNQESPKPNALPPWPLEVQRDWMIDKKEFLEKLKPPRRAVVVDVRPEAEFLGRIPPRMTHAPRDVGAINIPWTDFITESGEPDFSLITKLEQIGLSRDREILLIDDQGVRSGLASFVLRTLGFQQARNFAGGYRQLQ
ncbi:MAG: rhodanese-like domain-containing protein [Bdellovibrio sp.]